MLFDTIGPIIKEEHPGRYPQHDAFTSLVDVASSAPSLPVPKEENRRVCLPRGIQSLVHKRIFGSVLM